MRRLSRPRALGLLLVASLAAACSAEPSATTTSMASTTSTTRTDEGSSSGSSVVDPLPDRDADSTCPPETTPNLPGPPAHPRPQRSADTAWGVPYVMHDELGLVITIAAEADGFVTWGFDVCTNTWDRLRPRHEPDVDLGRWGTRLVYDADADLVVAFPGEDPTEVWVYSGDDNTWTEQPMMEPQPEPKPANLGDAVYEPGSGDILLRDSRSTRLWAYAVESNLWTEVEQSGVTPTEDVPHFHSLMTWDTAFDRLVLTLLGQPGETWVFDPGTGNPWVGMVGRPPDLNTSYFESGGEGVFDASVGKTIVFSDGLLGLYDLDDDMWEWRAHGSLAGWPGTQDYGPLARLSHTLVYDPVNLRVVLLGGHARYEDEWRVGDDVWALDLREGRWIELLASTFDECTSDGPPQGIASPADSTAGSPQVPVVEVILQGAPFMERGIPVLEFKWGCGFVVEPTTIVDGLLLPRSQIWDEGAVWWDTSDGQERWMELGLGGRFTIDSAIVQADDNDSYLLSYRDLQTGEWEFLWHLPHECCGGMQTRPNPRDSAERHEFGTPVTTDRLRFEGASGDNLFSVSEIQVFGIPAD